MNDARLCGDKFTTGMIRNPPTVQVYGFEKNYRVLILAGRAKAGTGSGCHVYLRALIGTQVGK